ncbi:g7394 [Coccomyxa elongata]
MRRRVNIPTGDLLDVIAGWPADKQDRAKKIIEEVEDEALAKMALNPGVVELCTLLDTMQIPRALLTRNTSKAVQYFHDQHFLAHLLPAFTPALAREFKPYKPSPAAVLHICREWGISPTDAVVIGDSAKDDVVCGNRAGAATILLHETGRSAEEIGLSGEEVPTFIARSLHEVAVLLKEKFDLRPNRQD